MSSVTADVQGPSDAELISAVRAGSSDAYGQLYQRHVHAAYNLARQLSRSPADADDLVSDAFAKVMTTLSGGGGPDSAFRAYLLTALRHTAYDRTRKERRVELAGDTNDLTSSATPEALSTPFTDTAVAGLDRSLAAQAFARLPERWQAVLWHTEIEGETPSTIAPILGMSPNAVSALAYRARERLREEFLQVHLAEVTASRCRATTERLGGWTRGTLSKREKAQVEAHLDDCARCRALAGELAEVNSALRGIIAPLVLGAGAAGYLATLGAGKAAAAVATGVAAGTTAGAAGAAGGSTGSAGAAAGAASGLPRQVATVAASGAALALAIALALAAGGQHARPTALPEPVLPAQPAPPAPAAPPAPPPAKPAPPPAAPPAAPPAPAAVPAAPAAPAVPAAPVQAPPPPPPTTQPVPPPPPPTTQPVPPPPPPTTQPVPPPPPPPPPGRPNLSAEVPQRPVRLVAGGPPAYLPITVRNNGNAPSEPVGMALRLPPGVTATDTPPGNGGQNGQGTPPTSATPAAFRTPGSGSTGSGSSGTDTLSTAPAAYTGAAATPAATDSGPTISCTGGPGSFQCHTDRGLRPGESVVFPIWLSADRGATGGRVTGTVSAGSSIAIDIPAVPVVVDQHDDLNLDADVYQPSHESARLGITVRNTGTDGTLNIDLPLPDGVEAVSPDDACGVAGHHVHCSEPLASGQKFQTWVWLQNTGQTHPDEERRIHGEHREVTLAVSATIGTASKQATVPVEFGEDWPPGWYHNGWHHDDWYHDGDGSGGRPGTTTSPTHPPTPSRTPPAPTTTTPARPDSPSRPTGPTGPSSPSSPSSTPPTTSSPRSSSTPTTTGAPPSNPPPSNPPPDSGSHAHPPQT